jgi:4-amino-4-deoxy-L-arabinose transferase-like glycosyltransferase
VPSTGQAHASPSDRLPVLPWLIAAAFVAVELAVSARYGYMQDELYFVEASRRLAFGYVDQPPLTPLLTRLAELVSLSPTVIRIIPALAGGAVVVLAARLAALFGAGRFGQVLAALTMASTPVLLSSDHVDNTTPIDLLAWTVVLLCVATALLRDRPRWWLGAGVAAGLGLENNNLMLLLLVAVGLGVLLSRQAAVLRTRWPWLGAGIAAVIWLPNLIWQATHGWPQLAMAAALRQENDSAGSYIGGLPAQLVYLGLVGAVLGVVGGAGRGQCARWPGADVHLHRVLRGGRRAGRAGLGRPPAARAFRSQRLLDVGTGERLRPGRAGGRRPRPAASLLR